MLEEIRIRGLGVIEDALVELAPGLTVITGETGAGKTMVVTGLDLLLGGRADRGTVRSGATAAVVEGRLRVDPDGAVAVRVEEAGGELDEGTLLVSRAVSAEGRSRAHLGGRQVPTGVLAELADELVAVHGQSDQQRLLAPARQRDALDRFAGDPVATPLANYVDRYERLRSLDAELGDLRDRARERVSEADLLRFGLSEVAAVAPHAGEDVALRAEQDRLSHADALRAAATTAHDALAGDPSGDAPEAGGLVGAARQALDLVAEHDPELAGLASRLAEAGYLLTDVAGDLAGYAEKVDVDPLRLAAVSERRAALAGLTRKYGEDVDAVLAWAEHASIRLAEIDGSDERVAALEAERAVLVGELGSAAGQVSAARDQAAAVFGAAVTDELVDLAMPHAQVSVEVRRRDDAEGLDVDGRRLAYGPHGVDEVELLLAPHPGAPARPLAKGASGGELSRVMLAVEVVFAGADPVPTFVFDEVDAGVGGAAAVEVGRRLARLARTAQVLVVTHLPQVAAFADHHVVVVKSDDGTVTSSGVTALDEAGRVSELARMLAGMAGSRKAAEHAAELLATARAERASAPAR